LTTKLCGAEIILSAVYTSVVAVVTIYVVIYYPDLISILIMVILDITAVLTILDVVDKCQPSCKKVT
jgi:hypothetical protein